VAVQSTPVGNMMVDKGAGDGAGICRQNETGNSDVIACVNDFTIFMWTHLNWFYGLF